MRGSITAVLEAVRDWGAAYAALAVVGREGRIAAFGEGDRLLPWASVTKLVTAYATLRTVEDGDLRLDEPLGPPGSTVCHLLAHASGLGPEGDTPLSAPERTRIYSNAGYDLLGQHLENRMGRSIAAILDRTVLRPLAMRDTRLTGRPSSEIVGPLDDMARLAGEFLRPGLVDAATLAAATAVAFPGLAGVLPGLGRFDPLDWGLGFEVRDGKAPHWTGSGNSPETFGHFGASGTFLWVDPVAGVALACLTDRSFGPWAIEAWPAMSDAILEVTRGGGDPAG